jgi:hypothetical protein
VRNRGTVFFTNDELLSFSRTEKLKVPGSSGQFLKNFSSVVFRFSPVALRPHLLSKSRIHYHSHICESPILIANVTQTE